MHVLNWMLKQRFMSKQGAVTAQSQGDTRELGLNKYINKLRNPTILGARFKAAALQMSTVRFKVPKDIDGWWRAAVKGCAELL